jgi:hypothetical protein
MASSAIVKLWTTVKDNAGRIAKTAVQLALANYNPTGTVGAAWKVIIEHLIGATSTVVKQTTAQGASITGVVTNGVRANREDKGVISLVDDNGVGHNFRVATVGENFATTLGSDTINLSSTLIAAWISAMASHAVTSDGVGFSGVAKGGRYIRHKPEKKGGY